MLEENLGEDLNSLRKVRVHKGRNSQICLHENVKFCMANNIIKSKDSSILEENICSTLDRQGVVKRIFFP